MLVSAAAIYGVGASSAFDYTRLQLDGLTFTDQNAVEAALADARGENLFGLSTGPLVAALESMPTVASARVQVQLPGTLAVTDRRARPGPRLEGRRRTATSSTPDGRAVRKLSADAARGRGEPAGHRRPPRRVRCSSPSASHLDPVDLDAATRLASLVPSDIGSSAVSLGGHRVRRERVRASMPDRRRGPPIFGFYTPSLRTTDLIPEQVRLLRSLLVGREPQVERVVLASATDGTYTPRSTPQPSPSSRPRRAKPSKAP